MMKPLPVTVCACVVVSVSDDDIGLDEVTSRLC
jgi:hypothetical protein